MARSAEYGQPKVCAHCGTEWTPKRSDALYCPKCAKGSWERNNPERAAEVARRKSRRYRHKLQFGDSDAYEHAVERFGERCAICKAEPDEGFHLAIDHDHATGHIRGLLCQRCNTGLGYFYDDPDRLHAAATYLVLVRS